MSIEKRNRPTGENGAAPNDSAQSTAISREEAKARLTGTYCVLVSGKTVRRHLYLNLPAAQRAVERAKKKGYAAHLILCQLVPVDSRELDRLVLEVRGE